MFVALALYVTEIGTPSDVGLVLAAHALPLVGFILLGGVLADRIRRTRVMIASDLVRFALHALLAALIFTGSVEIWHIVVIEASYGSAEAFFKPAQTGLLPQTVPEDEIQQARAASGTIETVAEFAGPALATALVLGLGAGWAFAIDAATFLVSIAFLLRVRPRERGEAPARPDRAGGPARRLAGRPRARVAVVDPRLLLGRRCCSSFAPWFTLGPTVAEDVYGSTGAFGVLVAAAGAGTIAGAVIGFRWRPLHPLRTGMLLALLWPLAMLAVALGLPLGVVVPRVLLPRASGSRCSGSGGRPRSPSACRRTCSRA